MSIHGRAVRAEAAEIEGEIRQDEARRAKAPRTAALLDEVTAIAVDYTGEYGREAGNALIWLDALLARGVDISEEVAADTRARIEKAKGT